MHVSNGLKGLHVAGVPVNDMITGCSNGNAYNSFQAIYWQMNEAKQGRPFLLDTSYGSDATGACLSCAINALMKLQVHPATTINMGHDTIVEGDE